MPLKGKSLESASFLVLVELPCDDQGVDDVTTNAEAASILELGTQKLRELLGREWDVIAQPEEFSKVNEGSQGWDAVLRITSPGDGIFTELLIDVRTRVMPKEVADVLGPTAMLVRRVNHNTRLMVFAPWISPRAQDELNKRGIDYLDLTGNVSLRVSRPAIVLRTQGTEKAPASHRPANKNKPMLTGPRAGRLVRLLTDVRPPYRATELANHATLSLAYVSRLLDSLEDQLVIERDGKVVSHVDWQQLLRLRASTLDLMHQTRPMGLLAPMGIQHVLGQVVARDGYVADTEVLVTGSYAARSVAPVAVGGQLMLYTSSNEIRNAAIAGELGLLPVSEGADVLLLGPWDSSVLYRPRKYEGTWQVGLSQLVLDCLSGPGRMPAEGEEVLKYMARDESAWRLDTLQQAGTYRNTNFGTDPTALF
ncbi:hypothetical protein [Streptomyces sp. NPDC014676]|uniref:hypothetical protein n=1 Tax=Streptomyces sp. NPDC014676 TaxID=3364879 RepID=UPI0037021EDF